jgi:hypothetical protein
MGLLLDDVGLSWVLWLGLGWLTSTQNPTPTLLTQLKTQPNAGLGWVGLG